MTDATSGERPSLPSGKKDVPWWGPWVLAALLGGGGLGTAALGGASDVKGIRAEIQTTRNELLSELRHLGDQVGSQRTRLESLESEYRKHALTEARRSGETCREISDLRRRVEHAEREAERAKKEKR